MLDDLITYSCALYFWAIWRKLISCRAWNPGSSGSESRANGTTWVAWLSSVCPRKYRRFNWLSQRIFFTHRFKFIILCYPLNWRCKL